MKDISLTKDRYITDGDFKDLYAWQLLRSENCLNEVEKTDIRNFNLELCYSSWLAARQSWNDEVALLKYSYQEGKEILQNGVTISFNKPTSL